MDLQTGDQPMSNEDGSVWVVYNGEIYNHLELRQDLVARGHVFSTSADTEVLVHGWEEWGTELLSRLNGIYAFALIDRRAEADANSIWLARDPVGVKPLYVGQSDGVWWFASELAAARECGLLTGGLRREALHEYLVYRFVPSPGTFFDNAWKLPPGHWCRITGDETGAAPSFTGFAGTSRPSALPRRRGEWEEAIRTELGAAVERQLMADVPLGCLLSGGIDSTVVARLMLESPTESPTMFAIGVDGDESPELVEARRAGTALGVPLVEVSVSETEFLSAWPASIRRMGEPIANTGTLLIGLLCQRVRETRKVALCGQGADEALGGYPRHAAERWYPLARRLRGILRAIPDWAAASDRVARVQRTAGEQVRLQRFTELLAVFSPSEVVTLTAGAADAEGLRRPVGRWLEEPPGQDSLNAFLRVDARLSLADDLLTVADATSMASSVELRVPFLDLRLLGLLEAMPSRYKVSLFGERKWLYRRAVARVLPASIRRDLSGWRARTGRKLGFSPPLQRWFSAWLHRDATSFLCGPQARLPTFLDPARVAALLEDARRRGRRERQVLALYVLEVWLRHVLP